MPKPLVIVESPAKAKTIAGFLATATWSSPRWHIRDLPSDARDIPARSRGALGAAGVDVDNGFKPLYVVVQARRNVSPS